MQYRDKSELNVENVTSPIAALVDVIDATADFVGNFHLVQTVQFVVYRIILWTMNCSFQKSNRGGLSQQHGTVKLC